MSTGTPRTTKGFSAVEATILLLVVAVLAFGGWYLWQRSNDKQSTSGNQTAQDATPGQQDETPVPDATEGGKYLVIDEWGVRFPIPDELQGEIYYTPDKETPNTMVVDSKQFPEGAECVSFSLARTTESANNPTDPAGFNSSSVKKIGNYYYSRVAGVIACSDKDDVHQKAAAIQRQLYDASASIEAVPQN